MNLLKALFLMLDMWRPAFCKEEAFIRAKELVIACLCAYDRKTITSMAIFLRTWSKTTYCRLQILLRPLYQELENTPTRAIPIPGDLTHLTWTLDILR